MPPKRKAIWQDFTLVEGDPSSAVCNHCGRIISRGKTGNPKGKMANNGMHSHLASKHYEAEGARVVREAAVEAEVQEKEKDRRARDETAMAVIPIYSLRTQKERREFLAMVISKPL